MGFHRMPTANDPPPKVRFPWAEENELVDYVALLLNGLCKRCLGCQQPARLKYLLNGYCPDCCPAAKHEPA